MPPQLPEAETDLEEFFDLLCVAGFDGHFERVNVSLERKAERFSRTVFDITHPDDVEPSREALAKGRDIVGFVANGAM